MVRTPQWKYIYPANGRRELLFDMVNDPHELANSAAAEAATVALLKSKAVETCGRPSVRRALDGEGMREFPFEARPPRRIYQFDRSRGVSGFPERPEDVILAWKSSKRQ